MSRRDTIMIAAFLNAGLLILLFITGLKTDPDAKQTTGLGQEQIAIQSFPEITLPKEPVARPSGDEVDQVLRDLAYSPSSSMLAAKEPVKPAKAPLEEINALGFTLSEPASATVKTGVAVPDRATIEVIVKKGDVLEKIARVHHTTTDQIMKQNQLTSTQLQIGQVLKITPNTISTKKETSPSMNAPESSKYYTVKNGDNPWTIAVKNQMKVEQLLKLNNLDEEKARRLKPGDQLRIR